MSKLSARFQTVKTRIVNTLLTLTDLGLLWLVFIGRFLVKALERLSVLLTACVIVLGLSVVFFLLATAFFNLTSGN